MHYTHIYPCMLGINVVEVAHDYQVQVQKYITNDLKLLNSYDGESHRAMCTLFHMFTQAQKMLQKKIATGTVKSEDQKWFGELSDKCTFILYYTIYMYIYYCTKNCSTSPDKL